MGEVIQNLGTLHSISCLRYESKHFFQVYYNLKLQELAIFFGKQTPAVLVSPDAASHTDTYNLFVSNFVPRHSDSVSDSPHVNIHGIMCRTDSVLLLSAEDFEYPHFGIISKINVMDDVKYFLV